MTKIIAIANQKGGVGKTADEGIDFIAADMNLEETQTSMQCMVGGQGNFLLKQIVTG